MILAYKKWRKFCAQLREKGFQSVPACQLDASELKGIVLKHDVETNVKRAFEIARIEHENGHCGSYYVQAYLLDKERNVQLLKKMQEMGHEISYHHDVMDSCRGNLDCAIEEFGKNKKRFEDCGFQITTVCQHGNPIVERSGYTSNRDFFRSDRVQNLYPDISDIMVNYQQKYVTNYQYYSDAGRCFRHIYDPLNNDIIDTSEKDTIYSGLDDLLLSLNGDSHYMISIHPHRWTRFSVPYMVKSALFYVARNTAKQLIKMPLLKKAMSKYYYLAKRF